MAKKKTISLEQRKDGRYKCSFKGKCFYGKTPEEAEEKRNAYMRLVEEGMQTRQVRVRDYAAQWLPVAKVGITAKTYNGYAKLLDYMNLEIGNYNLDEVKPSDIKRIYSKHFATFSATHIHHAKNLYVGLFDSAVEDGYIRFNPCRSRTAAPHRGKNGTHREITDEERYLIETTDHPLRPFAMTMLYAGLRKSEALALIVDADVDFKKKTVHVQRFRHEGTGNAVTVSDLGKNEYANRTIKLFPQLENVLEGRKGLLVSQQDGEVFSKIGFKRAWDSYVSTIECRINGCQKRWYGRRKIDLENRKQYEKLMAEGKKEEAEEYKLPPWKSFTVRPYDLRHSFATYCRDLEIDILVCMSWMGHSDSKMILSVYDHVSPKREEKEYQKILGAYQNEHAIRAV